MMMTRIALLFMVAASLYWTLAAGSDMALDCCLTINPQPLPRRLASSYRLSNPGCNLKAAVFTTKKGRTVCTPHPDHSEWVRKLIAHLDKQ